MSAFDRQDAASISPSQIEKVLTSMQEAERKPGTLVRHLTILKAIFNRAKRHGLVRDNPATLVKTPKPNNMLVRYLTAEQEAQLFDLSHPPITRS